MFGDLDDNKRRKEILSYHSNHSNQRMKKRTDNGRVRHSSAVFVRRNARSVSCRPLDSHPLVTNSRLISH